MIKERDWYFDFLRGIAIAMVVAIHTYVAVDEINGIVLIRQAMNCAVPLFLAISGYFIGKKDLSSLEKYKAFLKKQIPRVYVPMLLWSIPFLLINFRHSGIHLGMLTAFLGGCSVFSFIILIIEFYLLTPIIQKVSLSKSLAVSSLITLVGIILFVYLMHIKCYNIPLYLNGTPFILWLVFYVFGVKFRNGVSFQWWFLPLMFFFLLCSLGETYFYSINGKVAHGIKISSHFYSAFVILILLSKEVRENFVRLFENVKIIHWVAWLGRQSFFVYLCHMLVIRFTDKILGGGIWPVKIFITLVLCVIISLITKKIFNKKINLILGN